MNGDKEKQKPQRMPELREHSECNIYHRYKKEHRNPNKNILYAWKHAHICISNGIYILLQIFKFIFHIIPPESCCIYHNTFISAIQVLIR